jgi:hypothetical protein
MLPVFCVGALLTVERQDAVSSYISLRNWICKKLRGATGRLDDIFDRPTARNLHHRRRRFGTKSGVIHSHDSFKKLHRSKKYLARDQAIRSEIKADGVLDQFPMSP